MDSGALAFRQEGSTPVVGYQSHVTAECSQWGQLELDCVVNVKDTPDPED